MHRLSAADHTYNHVRHHVILQRQLDPIPAETDVR